MKKKIFAFSLCLAFILTALCVQFAGALPNTKNAVVSRQSRSVDEYRKVLDAISSGKENLADVYAGAYINGDNLLVINVTDASQCIKEKLKVYQEIPML